MGLFELKVLAGRSVVEAKHAATSTTTVHPTVTARQSSLPISAPNATKSALDAETPTGEEQFRAAGN